MLSTGEEGQDTGGLLREWYVIISRDMKSEDYEFYKGLDFLLENKVSDLAMPSTTPLRFRSFGSLNSASHLGRRVVLEEESSGDGFA